MATETGCWLQRLDGIGHEFNKSTVQPARTLNFYRHSYASGTEILDDPNGTFKLVVSNCTLASSKLFASFVRNSVEVDADGRWIMRLETPRSVVGTSLIRQSLRLRHPTSYVRRVH